MAIQGLKFLPPSLTYKQATELYKLLSQTNLSIGKLKSEIKHSMVNKVLMGMFSLQESVQSTRIEGTQVTFLDMLEPPKKHLSSEEQEVKNYSKALAKGIELIRAGNPISTRLIKELHKILMENNARGTCSNGGEFRKIQNFIGPDNNIEHAVYIPICANEIDDYMENLEFFINGEKHSSFCKHDDELLIIDENEDPILKAAIAHAQFESIHPFLDGNGRLGRILIALLAVSHKLVDDPIFLVSEELEKERARYYDLLNGIRGESPDWYAWLRFFVVASKRMADRLLYKLRKSEELASRGLGVLNLESEKNIWLYSFRHPITTVVQASEDTGLSAATVRKILNKLVDENLLYCSKSMSRNKRYINYDLVRILDS